MLAWIMGILPRVLLWAGVGAALIGVYVLWQKSVTDRAQLQWNNKQLELIVEDQENFKKLLEEFQEKQLEAVREAQERNEAIDKQYETIEKMLDAVEGSDSDKPVGDVLKDTIEELRKDE